MQNFLTIANSLAVLASIVLVFSLLNRHNISRSYKQAVMGIMFGLGAVLSLLQPIPIETGVQVDARNLFIGFAGATAGIIGASIAFIISATTRILIGGIGVWPGLISMGFCAIIGFAWWKIEEHGFLPIRLRWIILGAMISVSIFILLLLPTPIGWAAFTIGGPVLFTIYMIGSILLGLMVQNERNFDLFRRDLIKYADTDPLTNVLNRRGLQNRYQQAVRSKNISGISIIILDLNKFKLVNDTFGHDVGDKALLDVVSRVKSFIKHEDIFARLGGDEFVIISFNLDQDSSRQLIDRLNNNLIFDLTSSNDNQIAQFSVSAGGIFSDSDNTDLNKLLRLADKEMMVVKSSRRQIHKSRSIA